METDKRQIGPITTVVTGGVALAGIICYAIEEISAREIPDNIEWYAAVLFTIIAGWSVKPKAKRVAE